MATTRLGIKTDFVGGGVNLHSQLKQAFETIDSKLPAGGIPAFNPATDEGKVLKVVGGVLTWAADLVV